jgi:hypothetical protein
VKPARRQERSRAAAVHGDRPGIRHGLPGFELFRSALRDFVALDALETLVQDMDLMRSLYTAFGRL